MPEQPLTLSAQTPRRSNPPHPSPPGRAWRAGLRTLLLAVLFAAVAMPMIFASVLRGRGAYDQVNYHEKVVRTFAEQLPRPDLRDYLSATTPGYHLVIATLTRAALGSNLHAGESTPDPSANPARARQRIPMQLAGLTFTVTWLILLSAWLTNRLRASTHTAPSAQLLAIAALLPLAFSPYVLQSGVWLLPDNAGWLMVTAVLLLALGRPSSARLVLMGLFVLLAVWMRQIHLWSAGIVWAAGWLAATLPNNPGNDTRALLDWRDLIPAHLGKLIGRLALAILATLPALATLAWFYKLWGYHLIPPTFKEWYAQGQYQLGTPAFTLTLLGIYSAFFMGTLWPSLARAWQHHRAALALAGALGIALALIGPTSANYHAGRFGAIWSVVARTPALGDRSLLITLGSIVGCIALAGWLAGIPRRERWIMLAALAGFIASQTFNQQIWQRYHDPFVLLWLALAATLTNAGNPTNSSPRLIRLQIIGPITLALLLATWTTLAIAQSPPAIDQGWRIGAIQKAPSSRAPTPTPNAHPDPP